LALGALILCGLSGFPPAAADPGDPERTASPADTPAPEPKASPADTVVGKPAAAPADTVAPEQAAAPVVAPELQEAPEGDFPGRPEPWWRSPTSIMIRSALVPGWGQWSNGRHLKAVVVFGAEGYLIYRAVRAGIKEHDARGLARENPELAAGYLALAEARNNERRDYTWWTVFALILSMGDAYVDAVLGDFDVEFEPEPEETQVRAGFRLQWD
jgi:hypothetical protein